MAQVIIMQTAVETKRIQRNFASTAANKRFGRFGPEREQSIREADIHKNRMIARLKDIWRSVGDIDLGKRGFADYYERMVDLLNSEDIRCSAKDVEQFSVAMAEFQEDHLFSHKAGFFISALINTGNDNDYTVQTKHLQGEITYLGYCNKRNIVVHGNVEDYLGVKMNEGTIIINGNAGECVGNKMEHGLIVIKGDAGSDVGRWLAGGSIVVEGNVGWTVGNKMVDGSILVYGNADEEAGKEMKGGMLVILGNTGRQIGLWISKNSKASIVLEGDYGSINARYGRIYHKGKLIVNK